MGKNGQNWTLNGQNWTKLEKWMKMDKMDENGQNWIKNGQKWSKLDKKSNIFWPIFEPFRPLRVNS